MACSRLSYDILFGLLMCLAVITSTSAAHMCDNCNNPRCEQSCYGHALALTGKRTLQQYPNIASYIQDQIQYRDPEALKPPATCEMRDIYRAVPPSCYVKLDWLVGKAAESLLADE